MKGSFWQRLDNVARRLVPLGLTLVLILFSVVPLHIPGYSSIVPMLALISVYYWAIHRPRLLPPIAVFAVGLAQDFLSGTPLGLHAVVLLLTYGAIVSQRRAFLGKSFLVVWWGFLIVAFTAVLVSWILVSVLSGTLIETRAGVFQFLLTFALYPVMTTLFARVQRVLPQVARNVPGP